jgi:hypothetical protein
MQNQISEALFVLESANYHRGELHRGLRSIADFASVVRVNNVRASLKLQLRDVDSFIHKSFSDRKDLRYVEKTRDTTLTRAGF